MALSTDDTARLAALRTARDTLITGKAVAEVQYGAGQVVKYGQADIKAVRDEIALLEAAATVSGRKRGAVRFFVR